MAITISNIRFRAPDSFQLVYGGGFGCLLAADVWLYDLTGQVIAGGEVDIINFLLENIEAYMLAKFMNIKTAYGFDENPSAIHYPPGGVPELWLATTGASDMGKQFAQGHELEIALMEALRECYKLLENEVPYDILREQLAINLLPHNDTYFYEQFHGKLKDNFTPSEFVTIRLNWYSEPPIK